MKTHIISSLSNLAQFIYEDGKINPHIPAHAISMLSSMILNKSKILVIESPMAWMLVFQPQPKEESSNPEDKLALAYLYQPKGEDWDFTNLIISQNLSCITISGVVVKNLEKLGPATDKIKKWMSQ
ncbi:MAG: hypothetical protein HY823_00935 [Acidobacteria bacterium]|nr:hypothetical protein [Acidobacteriota bacterium]